MALVIEISSRCKSLEAISFLNILNTLSKRLHTFLRGGKRCSFDKLPIIGGTRPVPNPSVDPPQNYQSAFTLHRVATGSLCVLVMPASIDPPIVAPRIALLLLSQLSSDQPGEEFLAIRRSPPIRTIGLGSEIQLNRSGSGTVIAIDVMRVYKEDLQNDPILEFKSLRPRTVLGSECWKRVVGIFDPLDLELLFHREYKTVGNRGVMDTPSWKPSLNCEKTWLRLDKGRVDGMAVAFTSAISYTLYKGDNLRIPSATAGCFGVVPTVVTATVTIVTRPTAAAVPVAFVDRKRRFCNTSVDWGTAGGWDRHRGAGCSDFLSLFLRGVEILFSSTAGTHCYQPILDNKIKCVLDTHKIKGVVYERCNRMGDHNTIIRTKLGKVKLPPILNPLQPFLLFPSLSAADKIMISSPPRHVFLAWRVKATSSSTACISSTLNATINSISANG
ncbi:uncharacterized protein BDR25DRAFT_362604 [Lindgomyces ingoldianus]|uniref:Uncharacterized protein n=1 Tax=Lindgomyces ingoldianus TaxID=673940 RepID=A0ACB6Q996_9PLEO|nr:uncharacterized protein BDR25DRAFT_362604 [Lindgomyces ingoldianus]KAF2463604.1 hypothetical protein BDR25DRAFT_362604 [Lindgomyces ingoldianus]